MFKTSVLFKKPELDVAGTFIGGVRDIAVGVAYVEMADVLTLRAYWDLL